MMDYGYENATMLTPVNSSSAVTFGLQRAYVKVVCITQNKLTCRGIFYGDNPFKFVAPVFLAQLTLGSFLTSGCYFLLRPLFQTPIVGQVLGGIIAGPSVLGRNEIYRDIIFPPKSLKLLETLSLFGCMVFLFLVGVRMDMALLRRSGTREWVIGILTYVLPQLLSIPVSYLLHRFSYEHTAQVESDHLGMSTRDLPFVAVLTSMTSFHVISCLLHDLKLLNSELGRIAESSSMISGMLSWISLALVFSIKQSLRTGVLSYIMLMGSMVFIIILMVYGIRPVLTWMIRNTPEGKPIRESFTIMVFVLLLLCCFLSQTFGHSAFFVPMAFGLVVPEGPPLGSTMVDKIDCFVTIIMLPLYFLVTGEQVYVLDIKASTWVSVVTVTWIATMGKFMATILPCLYYQMPFEESLCLGLVLCSIGLLDIQTYSRAQQLGFINGPTFSVMCLTAPLLTGIVSFVVKIMYDPSRRYICYMRRTIENTSRHSELRVLVCVTNQETVPAIINVLEASNPTREGPMGVYVLNLFDLVGRASPLLVAHDRRNNKVSGLFSNSNPRPAHTERVINAFRIFESNNPGIVYLQAFTCIAPYATMYEDICTLALNKCTSFIILPFHKYWSSEGVLADSAGQKNVNKQVLKRTPCSVGILVDGGAYGMPRSIHESWSFYRIAVIFFGGADDRESLSYAIRMVDHPNVKLTLIRIIEEHASTSTSSFDNGDYSVEGKMDAHLINEFQTISVVNGGCNRTSYLEEAVTDSLDIMYVIQSMGDSYDLIITGRRHKNCCHIFRGLTEMIKFPELGAIGDILASNSFKSTASVLIVQQHTLAEQLNDDRSVTTHGRPSSLILDGSHSNKSR